MSNVVKAVYAGGRNFFTKGVLQYNYGMILRLDGVELPSTFEVDFSNSDIPARKSIPVTGANGEVRIPDELLMTGLPVYAYIYLHPTDESGMTVYRVTIPVISRPARSDNQRTERSANHRETARMSAAVSRTMERVETPESPVLPAEIRKRIFGHEQAEEMKSKRVFETPESPVLPKNSRNKTSKKDEA